MLAGNVFASFAGTQLSLGGDALNNQFDITEIAPNEIQVTGLGTTTINGAPSQVFVTSLIEDVVIRTGIGHDEVNVRNVSLTDTPFGNLTVIMDSGDDQINLNQVSTTESIVINTGDNNDAVNALMVKTHGLFHTDSGDGHDSAAFNIIRAGEMKVDMHDGDDIAKILRAKIGSDLTIHTGTQNDDVILELVSAQNDIRVHTLDGVDQVFMHRVRARNDVLANLGTGDDTLIMHTVKAGNHLDVKLEDGNDFAWINRAQAHDVYVDAGDDHDRLLMRNVHAIADLHAFMGSGDDGLKIEASSALNPHFDGGNGFDTLVDRPNAFDEVAASINFETIV